MQAGNDAAEQAFKLTIESAELVVKIAGSGMKHIAIALYVLLRDDNKTRGALRLKSMMKQNPNAVVYSVRAQDMKQFVAHAKEYGILYCALKSKMRDGMVDVLVRPEDAGRIDRIVKRFHLNAVATDTKITAEEKPAPEHETEPQTPEQQEQAAKQADDLLSALLGEQAPIEPEQTSPEREPETLLDQLMQPDAKEKKTENPTMARTEKDPPSEPFSEKSDNRKTGEVGGRKSVKQELKNIAAEQKQHSTKEAEKNRTAASAQKSHSKKQKSKNKTKAR